LPHAKGHHFLPQFLLKGFASRVTRKEHYAFVFRRGADVREPNIRDIAKQRRFHSTSAESNLEHLISVRESTHANLVIRLRTGSILPEDKPLIVEAVIHLGLRTRSLRDGFAGLGNTMMDAFEHKFSGSAEADKRLEGLLMQETRKQLTSPPLRDALMMLPVGLRKAFIDGAIAIAKSSAAKDNFARFIQGFRGKLDFSAVAEKVHLNALTAVQIEGAIRNRRDHFAGLDWRVVTEAAGSFILGDVGPIAKYHGSPEYTHIVKVEGVLDAAILPISGSCLLVGERPGFSVDTSRQAINRVSAELSRDFFVASQNTERERDCRESLGKRSAFMTEEDFLAF
jgi:hypothetical protein